jgi:hypothetical protein
LSEFACVPGAHRKAILLSVDLELQGIFYELRCRLAFRGVIGCVAKGAALRWELDLDPTECSGPFASQIRLGIRWDTCED